MSTALAPEGPASEGSAAASPDRRRQAFDLVISLVKYGVAGGSAVAVWMLVLFVLVQFFAVDEVIASGIGFLSCLPVNFLIQQHYVFKTADHKLRRALRYLAVTAVGGLINLVLYWLAVDVAQIQYLLAQIFVTGVVAVFNFVGNKVYTFKDEPGVQTAGTQTRA